jgi:hypothetical protein
VYCSMMLLPALIASSTLVRLNSTTATSTANAPPTSRRWC